MSLVQALNDIEDGKALVDYREETDTPIGRAVVSLCQDYNEKAIHNTAYRQLRADATGADLKAVFSLMEMEDQVNLVYAYNAIKRGAVSTDGNPVESPKERDIRTLRGKVVLIMICCIAVCICLLVGAMAVVGVQRGEITAGPVIDGLIEAATEIVKIIFSK